MGRTDFGVVDRKFEGARGFEGGGSRQETRLHS
jgi:hypothetical protein